MKLAVIGKQLTVLCIVLRLRFSGEKDGLLETGQLSILQWKGKHWVKRRERERRRGQTGKGRQGEKGRKGSPLIIRGGWQVWSGPALKTAE